MSKSGPGPIIILVASIAVLSGLTYYAVSMRDAIPEQPEDSGGGQSVQVPEPQYNGNDLDLDQSNTKTPPSNEDPIKFAVNSYLDQIPGVPSAGRVVDVVKKENGLVELHFAPDIIAGYGSEEERTIVQGILKTVGQFEDARQVFFMVEGEPLESLGHLDLTAPLDVER